MGNYFRQLLLPVALVSAIMLLLTVLWYQHEAELQRKLQIQQFTAALQISLRPYLNHANTGQLQVHLRNAQYASFLPVTAIALYDQQINLLTSTVDAEQLRQYQRQLPVNSFFLGEAGQHKLLALQPLIPLPPEFSFFDDPQYIYKSYYLLILLEQEPQYSFWLVPASLVSLLGVALLLVVHSMLRRTTLRQHTDISLLTHKLQQLQHGQLDSRINEELVAELQPLKQSFNALAEQKDTDLQVLTRRLNEQQQQLLNYQKSQDQAWQQLSDVTRNLDSTSLMLENWLKNCQILLQQQTLLSEAEILRLLQSQLTLVQLQQQWKLPEPGIVAPVNWLGQQLPRLQQIISPLIRTVNIIEGGENAQCQLQLPQSLLSQLLQALLQVSIQQEGVSELTLRFIADNSPEQQLLRISVTTDGQGMPGRTRQLLQSIDLTDIKWYEADIAVAALLAKKLSAQVNIQSLEGLGCTVQVNIPVRMKSVAPASHFQRLLVFDDDFQRLSERKAAFNAIATQVLFCSDASDLEIRRKQNGYDAAVIFLPDSAPSPLLITLLQQLAMQVPLLCYCPAAELAEWQKVLPSIPLQQIFCLDNIYQKLSEPTHFYPHLLVVDDNQTNLAFVQALLRNHPVKVVTAASAAEALLLTRQKHFDLILLDIQLPDQPGTEVVKQLRQRHDYREVPILAFTAHALESEVKQYRQAGMNDVILKPLEPARVVDILKWCRRVS